MTEQLTTKGTVPNFTHLDNDCRQVHAIDLMSKGMTAFKNIHGLTNLYIKGVALALGSSCIFFSLFYFFLYEPIVFPWLASYESIITGWASWLSWLTTPLAFLFKVVTWGIMAYLSLKASTLVMGLWIDLLIEKVMSHFREIPQQPFSIGRLLKIFFAGLKLTLVNLCLSLCFFILSFIPLIGPVLAFIGISRSSGTDILSPYVLLLAEREEKIIKSYRFRNRQLVRGGYIQAGICFIPFIGWVFLPVTLLLQIIGFAYFCEEKWQKKQG